MNPAYIFMSCNIIKDHKFQLMVYMKKP